MLFFPFIFVYMFVSNVAAMTGHYAVHGGRTTGTDGWHKRSRADSQSRLLMQVALAQQNVETAQELLISISSPTSSQFSQYLTVKEVAQKFAPSIQAFGEVLDWLNESGISRSRVIRSHSGGWLYFNATVSEAEQLLETEYHMYQHIKTRDIKIASDTYNVPTALQKHVDFVMSTIYLGSPLQSREPAGSRTNSRRSPLHEKFENANEVSRLIAATASGSASTSNLPSNCWQYTQLACLRALYSIPTSNFSHPNNSIGIFEPAYVSWLPTDLDSFFGLFMPSMVGQRPHIDPVDGGYWQTTYQNFAFNGEPDVDFEYSMSLVSPQNVTNYQVGDSIIGGFINDLLAGLDKSYCGSLDPSIDAIYPDLLPGGYNSSDCGDHKIDSVISISYANNEVNYPPAYEERQCLEYLKLGLQGVSVIVSSSDWGVAGYSNTCIDPSTGQANSSATGHFNPVFPASCPWVTSAGATQLPINSTISDPETAFLETVSGLISTSGGGFSNVFPAPSYQFLDTKEYLFHQGDILQNISARFNSTGRGYPDIATNAHNFLTFIDGELVSVCKFYPYISSS
jgi:tripeptidyl-peptidase I